MCLSFDTAPFLFALVSIKVGHNFLFTAKNTGFPVQ